MSEPSQVSAWLLYVAIGAGWLVGVVMFVVGQRFGEAVRQVEHRNEIAETWREVQAELRRVRCEKCGAPLFAYARVGLAGGQSHTTEPVHGTEAGGQGAGLSHRHPAPLRLEP